MRPFQPHLQPLDFWQSPPPNDTPFPARLICAMRSSCPLCLLFLSQHPSLRTFQKEMAGEAQLLHRFRAHADWVRLELPSSCCFLQPYFILHTKRLYKIVLP